MAHYFRFETPNNKINIYPLVCFHVGCPQSDLDFIREHVERIRKDPFARWIYMGDGGEVCTRNSKGDIFAQTLSPTAQQNLLVELLAPIRDKGLFGVQGNHGNRVYKETGLDFDETLCAKLGIPYLGVDAFWHLKVKDVYFSIYTHHGVSSGVSISSKVNKAKVFETTVVADAIFTAHSHVSMELPPRYFVELGDPRASKDPTKWSATHEYICGSAYDSRTGYAAEKGYPPLLPSHIVVTFARKKTHDGTRRKAQSMQVFRKENL